MTPPNSSWLGLSFGQCSRTAQRTEIGPTKHKLIHLSVCAVVLCVCRVILTFALLVGAGMQMVKLPHLIKGNKMITMAMVFLQLVCFVFLLAAMGHDVWSTIKYSGGGSSIRVDYGVTMSRGGGPERKYEDYCNSDNGHTKHTRRDEQTGGECAIHCISVSDAWFVCACVPVFS